jgi:hypothetical protein
LGGGRAKYLGTFTMLSTKKKILNSMENTENRRKICLFDVIWVMIIMASCARWLIWMTKK